MAVATDVVNIPLACGFDTIFFHALVLIKRFQLPVHERRAENIATVKCDLRLVPYGSICIVPKKYTAVICWRAYELREAPFGMKREIAKLAVETEPFMAPISIANNLTRC